MVEKSQAAEILAKQKERLVICSRCDIGIPACQFLVAKKDEIGVVKVIAPETALTLVAEKCLELADYLEESHPDFSTVECPLGFWGALEELPNA